MPRTSHTSGRSARRRLVMAVLTVLLPAQLVALGGRWFWDLGMGGGAGAGITELFRTGASPSQPVTVARAPGARAGAPAVLGPASTLAPPAALTPVAAPLLELIASSPAVLAAPAPIARRVPAAAKPVAAAPVIESVGQAVEPVGQVVSDLVSAAPVVSNPPSLRSVSNLLSGLSRMSDLVSSLRVPTVAPAVPVAAVPVAASPTLPAAPAVSRMPAVADAPGASLGAVSSLLSSLPLR